MSSVTLDYRVPIMQDMRRNGHTLHEIGAKFGVSRERARQMLADSGIASNIRQTLQIDKAKADRATLVERVITHLRAHPDHCWNQIGEALGVAPRTARKAGSSRLSYLVQTTKREGMPTHSDTDILDVLRDAAKIIGSPLSAVAYDRALHDGKIVGLSSVRIEQRFRFWGEACRQAGVTPGDCPRPTYSSRWTDQQMLDIVIEFIAERGDGSFHTFDAWLQGVEGYPSGQLVRNRLGGWTSIRDQALTALSTNDVFWDQLHTESLDTINADR